MRKLYLFTYLLASVFFISAQDPQFSQFYNTTLLINPAYTGTTDCYRTGMAARTQWLGLKTAYNTTLAFADFNYRDYNSGLGLMVLYDQSGVARLNNTELSALYSYQVQFSNYNLRLGVQGSYVSRSVDYSRILFEDQFNSNLDISKNITDDPIRDYTRTNYADFGAGLLFFKSNKYWAGFSAHHINQPEQGFYLDNSRLPVKYSVQLGYKLEYHIRSMTDHDIIKIYPCFLYKSEVKFDQADYGVYAYYNDFMLGLFYRGIYFKQFEDERNNDAITLHGGYHYKNWQFFYSYDFTVNNISIRNTWGSHEIAIVHKFCLDWPRQRKPFQTNNALPCPDFENDTYHRGNHGSKKNKKNQKNQNRGIGF
jgi:type IX secretion system PorP/SprF family membrane protein